MFTKAHFQFKLRSGNERNIGQHDRFRVDALRNSHSDLFVRPTSVHSEESSSQRREKGNQRLQQLK
jgi:hypothetical protein